jgi:hypothetical protein
MTKYTREPHYNNNSLIGYRIKKVIESPDLTGDPMSVFFTLTFANKLHLSCVDCQSHYLENGYSSHLKGNSHSGLKDISFDYHCHFPSYSYVLSVARNLSDFFSKSKSQIVVEGDANYLKKYDEYMDEHKIKPLFSKNYNSQVTRPHVHGLIKNIDIEHFNRILYHSKFFAEYWQPGCSCFFPMIEKNNDWVYRSKIRNKGEDRCWDKKHIIPYKERKPVGFYNVQVARDYESTENYIQKYIDKGGSDVRIF